MAYEVTIRELRQNLSVYLRRVEAGESMAVTRRGEPVAVLAPLPGRVTVLDRMAAEGRARPARGRLEDLPPPLPPAPDGPTLGELLEDARGERI